MFVRDLFHQNEQNLQEALSDSHSEIAQLRETATALRDEMERLEIEKEERIQKAAVAAHNELDQLNHTTRSR